MDQSFCDFFGVDDDLDETENDSNEVKLESFQKPAHLPPEVNTNKYDMFIYFIIVYFIFIAR